MSTFPTQKYHEAVAQKQAAAGDIELAKNQRFQERTKAETLLLSSKEEARRVLDTARNEANLTLTATTLKAEETLFAFETEASVIRQAKTFLNLTTDGVLSYMANRLYANAKTLRVSAGEPAQLSRKGQL